MSRGIFQEIDSDEHVHLRRELLGGMHFRFSRLPVFDLPAWDPGRDFALISASLRTQGVTLLQLREPLKVDEFIHLGENLGLLLDELDPETKEFRVHQKILAVRKDRENADSPALEPFSTSWLALHSERSSQPISAQPRYIVLMCVEADDQAGQTVLVDSEDVVLRLSSEARQILQETRYDNPCSAPLLRRQEHRWVLSILDYQSRGFRWTSATRYNDKAVNLAIRQLYAEMYRPVASVAVTWTKGQILVLDNTRFLHGRTRAPAVSKRSLWRLRILERPLELFSELHAPRRRPSAAAAHAELPEAIPSVPTSGACPVAFIDHSILEVFNCAADPTNPRELHDLWIGQIEASLCRNQLWPELAAKWHAARPQRVVTAEEVLQSRAYVRMVKELSNTFFRDELYGCLKHEENILLSTGSSDESAYGIGPVLAHSLQYAVKRNWYGYSDTRGLAAARAALAEYETLRLGTGSTYDEGNVTITMGATHAISSLADFISASNSVPGAPALIAIPNYAPMVEAIARRLPMRLVPTTITADTTDLTALREALSQNTPVVFLQTVTNPTGTAVNEDQLAAFISAAHPGTIIVLDESHEFLGPKKRLCSERAKRNVIRVRSVSKEWSAPGLRIGWFLAATDFSRAYFEHASSSYGCPPSLSYLFVELLALFEKWMLLADAGMEMPNAPKLNSQYGLRDDRLRSAFAYYRDVRCEQRQSLLRSRIATNQALDAAGIELIKPRYSLNTCLRIPTANNSYAGYRERLTATRVALFPTALNFMMEGNWLRLTYGVTPERLHEGLRRLVAEDIRA